MRRRSIILVCIDEGVMIKCSLERASQFNQEGVPQDDKQAVHWYTKSAEQGFAAAQYNLGMMYAEGKGVPQDDKQAVHWSPNLQSKVLRGRSLILV